MSGGGSRGRVSVVIPAYAEDDALGSLLESVTSQVGAGEVIVVNAGGRAEIAHIAATVSPVIRVIGRGRLYPGAARNLGAAVACGDVVAFLDAGLEVGAEWLEEIVAPLLQGTADVAWGATRARARTAIEQVQAAAIWPRSGVLRVAANVALTRGALETVGEFEERIRAGEDLEWRHRVRVAAVRSVEVDGATAVYGAFCPTVAAVGFKWWQYTHHQFAGGRPDGRKLALSAVGLAVVAAAGVLPAWWGLSAAAAYALVPVAHPLGKRLGGPARPWALLRGWPRGLAARVAMDAGRTVGIASGLLARALRL